MIKSGQLPVLARLLRVSPLPPNPLMGSFVHPCVAYPYGLHWHILSVTKSPGGEPQRMSRHQNVSGSISNFQPSVAKKRARALLWGILVINLGLAFWLMMTRSATPILVWIAADIVLGTIWLGTRKKGSTVKYVPQPQT